MGLGYTRNVGIDNAVGDYILFVDSDDYISLNTCEEIEAVLSYNNEVDIIVLGRYRFADEVYMQDPISKGKTCFETGESYLLHCVKMSVLQLLLVIRSLIDHFWRKMN